MPLQEFTFEISRFTDFKVFESLRDAFDAKYAVRQASFQLPNGVEFKWSNGNDSAIAGTIRSDAIVIRRFEFSLSSGVMLNVIREFDNGVLKGSSDKAHIKAPPDYNDITAYIEQIAIARAALRAPDGAQLHEFLTDSERNYYQQREASLQRLQLMQDDFFKKFQEFTVKQVELQQKRQHDAEEQLASLRSQLQQEHADALAAVAEERSKLDEERKKLDERSNTHARRDLRKDVVEKLTAWQAKFGLTTGTKRLRWPVVVGYSALLGVLGYGAVHYLQIADSTAVSTGPEFWHLVVRESVLMAGFVLTATMLLKFCSRWAEMHASEELRHRRLVLDIDRANWLVEMALEWRREKGSEIPEYLVERLSRGMYAEIGQTDAPMTAADAVADFFTSASTARFKGAGAEVELTRKGKTKRAEKE